MVGGDYLGSILGLLVFSIYSYYQIRDKTTLYFCFWLTTAVLVIVGQFHHDGIRLLEFLIDPVKDNFIFQIYLLHLDLEYLLYVQAMMFVIFARQFISLKNITQLHFNFIFIWFGMLPTFYFTSVWVWNEHKVNSISPNHFYRSSFGVPFYYSIQRYRNGCY